MKVVSIKQISRELNIQEEVIFREIQKLVESPDSLRDKLRFVIDSGEDKKVFIVDYSDLSFIGRNAEKGPIFLADYFKIDRDDLINIVEQMRTQGLITSEVYKAIFEVKDKPALKSWFEPDVIITGDSSSLYMEIYAMNVIESPKIFLDVPSHLEVIERPRAPEKLLPGKFMQRYLIKAERHGEYKIIITLEGTMGGRKLSGVTSPASLRVKPLPPEIEVELLTPQEISATLNREFNIIFQIRNMGRGDCLNMAIDGLDEYRNFVVVSGAHVGNLASSGVLKHTLRLRPRKSGKFTLDKLYIRYQDAEGKTESKTLPPIIIEVKTLQPELKVDLIRPTIKIKEKQEFPLTIRVINIGKGEARNVFIRLPISSELIVSGYPELFIPKINVGSSEEFELTLRAPKENELRINAFNVEFEDEEGNKRVEGCPGILIPISVEEIRPVISEKPWPFVPGGKIGGKYYVIQEIGEGGFAKVYLAEQLIIRSNVALKALKPQFIRDQEKIERLIFEAKIVRDLRHPNIVAYYDVDIEEHEGEKYPFIVMEYLPDGTLQKQLVPSQPCELNEVMKVLHDMCEALQAAHWNKPKIIHCDIKPSNIFYSREKDLWKLGDFSLSIIMRGKEAESKGGSLLYMAPEVLQGRVIEKSDIYSLGVVMREMLTGRTNGDLSEVKDRYRDFDELLLQELITLVERMTDRDPTRRPDLMEVYRIVEKIRSPTLH